MDALESVLAYGYIAIIAVTEWIPMHKKWKARILILCKTYPSPSAKYAETSCVAGMDENGRLIRLFPVPFRLINSDQQFRKWQWINALIEKSADRRPESHKIFVDTIEAGECIDTRNEWRDRRHWIDKLPSFSDFGALEEARKNDGITLGVVRPHRVVELIISPASSEEWTDKELEKLQHLQQQESLFEDDLPALKRLQKIPFDFYYVYECLTESGPVQYKHKIVDWEACQLYRNVVQAHGKGGWEAPFRQRMFERLPSNDLMLLLGTIHRFPGQWLIVSLIYPPKLPPEAIQQGSLF